MASAPIKKDYQIDVTNKMSLYFCKSLEKSGQMIIPEVVPLGSRVIIFVDEGVVFGLPSKVHFLKKLFRKHYDLVGEPIIIQGGEESKNGDKHYKRVLSELNGHGVDRHSYVIAIGGGAFLDVVGFACSTYHRGVSLVRLPTTVLAQADAGVGVKNGINLFDQKNFVGNFHPPVAVINDFSFLASLPKRHMRSGLAEIVKVALIKDEKFFEWIESNIWELAQFSEDRLFYAIERCADMHLEHIVKGGDPFESGSGRPLDFGHWSAHKIEMLSRGGINHGEAVALGMALDSFYSLVKGQLGEEELTRILRVLRALGFEIFNPVFLFQSQSGEYAVLEGLEEFRIHLGGDLNIPLLHSIGKLDSTNHYEKSYYKEGLEFLMRLSLKEEINKRYNANFA